MSKNISLSDEVYEALVREKDISLSDEVYEALVREKGNRSFSELIADKLDAGGTL